MPAVRRRLVSTVAKPTRERPRDRVAREEEEDEDVDLTPRRPAKKRPAVKAAAPKRRPVVVEEEEEQEEDEEVEEEEDYEEEEEEEEAPRPRKVAAKKAAAPRRPARRVVDEEDEDEAPAARSAKRTKVSAAPGIYVGEAGADQVRSAGGGSSSRFTPTKSPTLMKFLESGPFVSFRQHWIEQGRNKPNRPYVCIGDGCPLCDMGDSNPTKTFWYNVLIFSMDGEMPINKILPLGVRADEALKSAATPRNSDKPKRMNGFFAVSRSGKEQQSQTNFKPVRERDLVDEWPEIFDSFEVEELEGVIEEAKDRLFDIEAVDKTPRKTLLEVARHLADDDDQEEDEDE